MPDSQGQTINFRPATVEDVENLALFIEPFLEDGRVIRRTTEELQHLVHSGFVAECHEQIVGFAALEIYSRKLAEIRSLVVSPLYQGLGIGKRLVSCCVALAKERQVLEVMAITSSDDFFRSCGFDFTLPRERKALFIETHREVESHEKR